MLICPVLFLGVSVALREALGPPSREAQRSVQ